MENFKEYFEQENGDEGLMEYYHDLVGDLLDKLSENVEILSDDITDLIFELQEVAEELAMDDDDYEEMTGASAVGNFKPPFFNEDELDEIKAKKKKIKKIDRLNRRKLYRRNKSKLKTAGKRLRKTSKFKKYKKKAKRLGKRGLTTKGSRVSKFV